MTRHAGIGEGIAPPRPAGLLGTHRAGNPDHSPVVYGVYAVSGVAALSSAAEARDRHPDEPVGAGEGPPTMQMKIVGGSPA